MLDFLKIKYLSRYVDKLMEWKKYVDYKKALKEQTNSSKPANQEPANIYQRKGSFGFDAHSSEGIPNAGKRRPSELQRLATFGTIDNSVPSPSNSNPKIRIAGYDIDLNYFQKSNEGQNPAESVDSTKKNSNVNLEGLNEFVSEPFELTADNLLDTSNVHINLNLKSMYIYLLKSCTAFAEFEFRRFWLYGNDPSADLQKSFNKRIPTNYFQLKLTKLNLSLHTKEGLTALTFSSFKILDVNRIEAPLKYRSANNSALLGNPMGNKSHSPWNKSEVFHSFRMERSMINSGIRLPGLKRDPSSGASDVNDSMLFQSATSDITKDFLTMREIRKQIIDWELDSKREHFCVNVVFKFNKGLQSYFSKEKKSSEVFKTVKYLEDSIIHSPLNTDPLIEELGVSQTRPTLRLQNKGSKIIASLDLPPVYVNFYMGLVHDINFLLHNASDSYKLCENWYLEQNQNLIRKWEQELRENSKEGLHREDSTIRRRETIIREKEKVQNIVDNYYKRQNQLMNVEVSLGIPFIKIAVNLENTKKDPNHCFCGFSSHYFADNLIYHPIFKRDFIVMELSQLAVKVLKVPANELFLSEEATSQKSIALQTQILLQSFDTYLPSKVADENRVFMVKLLSLRPIRHEGKLVVPSLALTMYDDDTNTLTRKGPNSLYKKDSLSPLSGFSQKSPDLKKRRESDEEEKDDNEDESLRKRESLDNQRENMERADSGYAEKDEITLEAKMLLNNRTLSGTKVFNTYFQRHMNKFIASDPDYLRLLEEESAISLKVTLPKFEIFASKQSVEFLQNFGSGWLSLVEDFNEKVAHLLEQERRLFASVLEPVKPLRMSPITNLSIHIEEIGIQIFQDEKVKQNFQQMVESKKHKLDVSVLGANSVCLDASFSNPMLEKSYQVSSPHGSEMRCYYPDKEFEKVLESALKIMFRQNEAIIYKNPRDAIEIIHMEIYDLLVVDKQQEKPYFGSFMSSERDFSKEFYDEEKQYEAQECIIYKQSCLSAWRKPLNTLRLVKEPESFKELLNKGITVLDNTHYAFEHKNKNVISIGLLKSIKGERPQLDIEARLGLLVLRSDLKLGFINTFKDLADCFKTKASEKKEEDHYMTSFDNLEKKEPQVESDITVQCSLENIIVDLNPYLTFDYCKTFGKVYYDIDQDSLTSEQKNLLFYSDTRSLLALECLTLKLAKKDNKVQFEQFELSSLDLFMRHQKGSPSFQENRVILRSKEDRLFERDFEELRVRYGFKSHPFYLSGLSVKSSSDSLMKLDIKLEKIELLLYSDTIPTIEKHIHLILCLIDKNKQKNNEEEDDDDDFTDPRSMQDTEADAVNLAPTNQENKPKDHVYLIENIEIDRDFFSPVDVLRVKPKTFDSIRMGEENKNVYIDDDVEEIDDDESSPEIEESNNKSYETVNSMPSVSTSFVSSSTVFYFDEDNLHDFSLDSQSIFKRYNITVGEVTLRIYESYEFDSNPVVIEIPFAGPEDQEASESQGMFLNQNQNSFGKLSNDVNAEKAECIMVVLESFSLGVLFFKKNEQIKTNLTWRASVMLENFEVLDCFKNSKKSEAKVKLLCKHNPKAPKNRNRLLQNDSVRKDSDVSVSNTFNAIFECFEHNKCQQKDLRVFAAFHPNEVYFGMPHYNFSKLFLEKMNLKSPTTQVKEQSNEDGFIKKGKNVAFKELKREKRGSEFFVSFFYVAPIKLKMNVNLDISVFNLDLFQDLNLLFPSLVVRGSETPDELRKEAVEFYVRIVKKQLGKFIKDLPLLRNIKNLTSATLNIFYSPYLNYRESGNLLYGLKDGFFGFVDSVSNESVNLFTFVTTFVDNMTNISSIRGKFHPYSNNLI